MVTSAAVLAVIRTARPAFRNMHDKVAFAIHALFVTSGYRLIAAGAAAEADTSEKDEEVDVGIDGWNELPEEYDFKYATPEDSLKAKPKRVLVKCLVIGESLTVDAVEVPGGGEGVVQNAEIRVSQYASSQSASNYGGEYTDLNGLVTLLESTILHPLTKKSAAYEAAAAVSSTLNPNPVNGGRRPGSILEDARQPGRRSVGGMEGGGMMLGPNDPRWGVMGGGGGPFRPGMPPGMRNPGGGRRGFNPNHPDLEQYRDDF